MSSQAQSTFCFSSIEGPAESSAEPFSFLGGGADSLAESFSSLVDGADISEETVSLLQLEVALGKNMTQ